MASRFVDFLSKGTTLPRETTDAFFEASSSSLLLSPTYCGGGLGFRAAAAAAAAEGESRGFFLAVVAVVAAAVNVDGSSFPPCRCCSSFDTAGLLRAEGSDLLRGAVLGGMAPV